MKRKLLITFLLSSITLVACSNKDTYSCRKAHFVHNHLGNTLSYDKSEFKNPVIFKVKGKELYTIEEKKFDTHPDSNDDIIIGSYRTSKGFKLTWTLNTIDKIAIWSNGDQIYKCEKK